MRSLGERDCERKGNLRRKQVYMGGKVDRLWGKMWGKKARDKFPICHQRLENFRHQ